MKWSDTFNLNVIISNPLDTVLWWLTSRTNVALMLLVILEGFNCVQEAKQDQEPSNWFLVYMYTQIPLRNMGNRCD